MSHSPYSILAANDGSELFKLIPFFVFALLWLIGGVASAIGKAQEKARQGAIRPTRVPPSQRATPRPAKPLPQNASWRQAAPPMLVQRHLRAIAAARQPARVIPPVARTSAPAIAQPVRVARPPATPPPVPASRPAAAVAARSVSGAVSGRSVQRLLQPTAIRQQFILLELLQPPVSLRERPPGAF